MANNWLPRRADYVYGGPGGAHVETLRHLQITSTRRSNGAVTTSTSSYMCMWGRDQRPKPVKGARKALPGLEDKSWRCATDYYSLIHNFDYDPGDWTETTWNYITRRVGWTNTDSSHLNLDGYPIKFPGGSAAFDSNVYYTALDKAYSKMAEDKVHFLTALAEARRSVNMVAHRAGDLARALLRAKKGSIRRGVKETPQGLYLEYMYGWKPLITDLANAVGSVKKAFNPPLLLSVQGFNSQKGEGTRASKGYHRQDSGEYKEIAFVKMVCQLDSKYKYAAQGLGLNPLTTAWELVPWSFVADWVVPIGSVLENLSAPAGLTLFDGYYGRGLYAECRGKRLVPSSWVESKPQSYRVKSQEYRRTKLRSFPWGLPYVKSPFSTTHTVNAIALIAQLASARAGRISRLVR